MAIASAGRTLISILALTASIFPVAAEANGNLFPYRRFRDLSNLD